MRVVAKKNFGMGCVELLKSGYNSERKALRTFVPGMGKMTVVYEDNKPVAALVKTFDMPKSSVYKPNEKGQWINSSGESPSLPCDFAWDKMWGI